MCCLFFFKRDQFDAIADVEVMAASGRMDVGETWCESLSDNKGPGCSQRSGLLLIYIFKLGDDA